MGGLLVGVGLLGVGWLSAMVWRYFGRQRERRAQPKAFVPAYRDRNGLDTITATARGQGRI